MDRAIELLAATEFYPIETNFEIPKDESVSRYKLDVNSLAKSMEKSRHFSHSISVSVTRIIDCRWTLMEKYNSKIDRVLVITQKDVMSS